MSDAPRIVYRARKNDISVKGEFGALASVYAFCLRKHQEKQKGGYGTAPDARKESNGSGKVIVRKQS
jgi:hypothetical protein